MKLRGKEGHLPPDQVLSVSLEDLDYDTKTGVQISRKTYSDLNFNWTTEDEESYRAILTINENAAGMTEKGFRNKKIRLVFKIKEQSEFYIEKASLFKAIYLDDGSLMTPDSQPIAATVKKTYRYYPTAQFASAQSLEDLTYIDLSEPNYNEYTPVYVEGAQKLRAILAKESNYFNILQNIAETFEAWLDLIVTHNEDGTIAKKEVAYKNYIGKDNYAGFRYGVNLKEI